MISDAYIEFLDYQCKFWLPLEGRGDMAVRPIQPFSGLFTNFFSMKIIENEML